MYAFRKPFTAASIIAQGVRVARNVWQGETGLLPLFRTTRWAAR
jgi:hypothetical protein